MKKLFLILCALLCSCATIEYEGFRYTRFFKQELIDVTINMTKLPDGTMILESHLGKQLSEQEISDIIKAIMIYGIVP